MHSQDFAAALKDLIFCQRDLEQARIDLVLRPDFNLEDAFAMLDIDRSSCLNAP